MQIVSTTTLENGLPHDFVNIESCLIPGESPVIDEAQRPAQNQGRSDRSTHGFPASRYLASLPSVGPLKDPVYTPDFRRAYPTTISGWLGHSDTRQLLNGDLVPFGMFARISPVRFCDKILAMIGPITVSFASVSALLAFACSVPLQAQWLHYPTTGIPRTADGKPNLAAQAPRTADGKPDLSGLWNKISPKYSRNIAADLKPGDVEPWAEKLTEQRKENLEKDYMNVLCVPLGPGYATDADSTGAEMMKIVQTPGLIIILNPDLTYRQIFMDGRPLEKSPNPDWMGYSTGHWEDDTLVVESTGFNDRTWLDHDGHPHTEALHMTERYRRRNAGNLDVDITLSDPGAYVKPWTVSVRAELAPDTEMIEWVCNENHHGVEHWVGKASDQTKNAARVPPAILSKYIGVYDEQPKLWRLVPRVVEISVSEDSKDKIFANMDGRGKVPLIAESETSFSGLYGLGVEFRDGGLYVKHVSGDYRFARRK